MSAEVFVFQECSLRLTEGVNDDDWDAYYYARWGDTPDSGAVAWTKTLYGSASAWLDYGDLLIDTTVNPGAASAVLYYENKTALSNGGGYTVEFRMGTPELYGGLNVQAVVAVQDNVFQEYIKIGSGVAATNYGGKTTLLLDTERMHLFRVQVLGSSIQVYIDNTLAIDGVLTQAAVGSGFCRFGDPRANPSYYALTKWDFVRFKNGSPPYTEALDLGQGLVRNVLLARRPRTAYRVPNVAAAAVETRVRAWETTVTLSGDALRLSDFKDLAVNKDYRLEIDGYNRATSQMESLVCERCRLAEQRWGAADNGNLGHGITFSVDGRVY